MSSSSSSAKFREHSHGRQDRDFTPEQKAAVERIRRCKATAYYEILALEKESSDGQIKKAYHKLSLATHPDKNGAPGADEAFKLVSKAFQVLSDPQKRSIFDQTGADPDSRGGGAGAGGGGGGGGGARPQAFTGFQGAEISPEDLFNMFFSGGMGGMGGGPFGDAGGFQGGGPFAFGGPGIRVHQFGGGGPRMRRRAAGAQAAGAGGEQEPTNPSRIFWQLLPLILFFLLPMLSGLFGGDTINEKLRGPGWSMEEKGRFTDRRSTPKYGVSYFVDPVEVEGLGMRDVTKLGLRAEAGIVGSYNAACTREEMVRQQKLQDAQGYIFTDYEKLKEAREMELPSCQKLKDLGLPRQRQF